MSAILQNLCQASINAEIECHPAWMGRVSGLKAEKMLRGSQHPYLYLLRGGEWQRESETDYYVTFVLPDFSITHTPFVITVASEGWYCENGGNGGPYTDASIDDVMHLIMHCKKDACTPMVMHSK